MKFRLTGERSIALSGSSSGSGKRSTPKSFTLRRRRSNVPVVRFGRSAGRGAVNGDAFQRLLSLLRDISEIDFR